MPNATQTRQAIIGRAGQTQQQQKRRLVRDSIGMSTLQRGSMSQVSKHRKLLSILAHLSATCSWTMVALGVPIAILCTSDDDVVKANAAESINYHITCWVLMALLVAVVICTFGVAALFFFVLWPLFVIVSILPFIAVCCVALKTERPYLYPLVPRFIKTKLLLQEIPSASTSTT
jgi:uncharacterized protein